MKAWPKTAWTGALLLSLLVHGGAAALLAGRADPVQIAGGNPVDIAVLGNSFEDAISAGEATETVEPATADADQPEEVETAMAQPVQPATAAAVSAETAGSPESMDVVEAEAAPVADATVSELEGTVAVPAAESPNTEEQAAAARPEEARPRQAEAATEVETEAAEVSDVETAEAVEAEETVNPVADAPIPMPRPDIEALKAEEERREAERVRQAQRQQPAPQPEAPRQQPPQRQPTAGAGGTSQADARRGDAAGSTQGRAAQSSGQGSAASAAGNAAVSNYPGQVVTRLRRALSYPAQARRQRITGEVHVSFTIAANGGVSGVSVVRSSGHAVLDEAARQTVHRAAPFPAIPPAAGRSSWGFTVPLAFSR